MLCLKIRQKRECAGFLLINTNLSGHTSNKSNPHGVTKSQIGLGNVDNIADSNKSVNYASSSGNADTLDGWHNYDFLNNINAKVLFEVVQLGYDWVSPYSLTDAATTKKYGYPSKSGYSLAAVTPYVEGDWADVYAECDMTNSYVCVKNIHPSTSYIWTTKARCVWVRN